MNDADRTKEHLVIELEQMRKRIAELEVSEAERKRVEDEVRSSEERLRILFEFAPDGYYLNDLKGNFVDGNKAAEEITGYARNELIGKSFLKLKLLSPDQIPKAAALLARNALGQPTGPDEFSLERKDGIQVPVEIRTFPVKMKGQHLVLGIARDITRRKQAEKQLRKYYDHLEKTVGERTAELKAANEALEQDITRRRQVEAALRESENRYRILAENVTDVIWTMDMNLRFTYCSPAITTMLGYSVDETITKTPKEILAPASFDVAMKVLAERTTGKNVAQQDLFDPVTVELELNRKDGTTVWCEVRATFLGDADGQPIGFLGISRDITQRKQAEEELRGLYAEERKLRRQLEEEIRKRIEFTRVLVHELKTPLTPLLASSELMLEELKKEPLLSLAKHVYQGADNLNQRIDELLDLARGEIGILRLSPKEVDPVHLLQEVIDSVTPVALLSEQYLHLELPSALPTIWADESRLRQIVLNLLNNAFKFTPVGGEITLRAKKDGGSLIVEVQDTGRGLTKKEQRQLFESYRQLDENGARLGGLGLGLALAKKLVELHGGEIWVKGRKGEGSIFSFSVPLANRQKREGIKTR